MRVCCTCYICWLVFRDCMLVTGPVAAEQKYDGGAGVRGCKVADYLHEASACEGQELGGLKPPQPIPPPPPAPPPPPSSAALGQGTVYWGHCQWGTGSDCTVFVGSKISRKYCCFQLTTEILKIKYNISKCQICLQVKCSLSPCKSCTSMKKCLSWA